ncbi:MULTISPECIES: DUF2187 family protein [Bacillus]|uniref:DUF2187 family protein n=1 Tax=Bacillus TaxID=1386 RepID=UPI000BECA264|nr:MULTISPECIES: DUF2187 family protein [Bacillus]MBC6972699.1 DUF2187 family protein [Bacillus sp. Xin]NSW38843.1 DUF2187 family protein [Bacillus sp. Xin1]PED07580.1 DUF2187 domain-containing protein [Bacillus pseudomycoides]PEI99878.1 DUF2187 domain-containing protein [Bacillus pseudomycoides]PEJ22405.1 DUF2187 domain-containing protein [Bacillus pseudomycoides]
MEKTISVPTIKIGDFVQFPHRKNPSIKLTGYVVNILTNTIIVDISEMLKTKKYKEIDTRHVVKHGRYKKVRVRKKQVS